MDDEKLEGKTVQLDKVQVDPDEGDELTITKPFSRKAVLADLTVQRKLHLQISVPGHDSWSVDLDKDEVVIGRVASCDVHLPLTNVSRQHAHIVTNEDSTFIQDLDSTNGVFVNGIKIVKCILRNNDVIQVGDSRLLFVEEKTRQPLK